jgi:hypothetical protein
MENTPYLYNTLVLVLRQHRNWLDLRHLNNALHLTASNLCSCLAHFGLL